MAITRRQFVTRMSTLGAAMGMSQMDLAKLTEAFAHGSAWAAGGWTNKPKVVWVHGAECTGCSTSLLSLFEDVRGNAIEGMNVSTLAALDLAVGGSGNGDAVLPGTPNQAGHGAGHRTIAATGVMDFDGKKNAGTPYIANIADVLIDFIDLQYHETVMSMGGDLAYQWLDDLRKDAAVADPQSAPFVLVVEGAVQPFAGGGYWDATGAEGDAAWCAIGMSEDGAQEHSFDAVVHDLSLHPKCAAIIPIGQCACFGGYPACVSPVLGEGQTGAMGVAKFLETFGAPGLDAVKKVINVPGCPTNPWWFVLTVVAWLVDFVNPGTLGILEGGLPKASAVDKQRRLKAVYPTTLHGPFCSRNEDRKNNIFANQPGDPGCLQLIGCKGPQAMTLCGPHGWNGQQPQNDKGYDYGIGNALGGHAGNCVGAGHPCMACTEQGYPDAFLPFVAL